MHSTHKLSRASSFVVGFVAILALSIVPRSAEATFLDFTSLENFLTPELVTEFITVTAVPDANPDSIFQLSVTTSYGLGVAFISSVTTPPIWDKFVTGGGEDIIFDFARPTTGIIFTSLGLTYTDQQCLSIFGQLGCDTSPDGVQGEAFGVDGTSLGHFFFGAGSMDFGAIFGSVPIQRIVMNPGAGDPFGGDGFSIVSVQFILVPEPSTLALITLGIAGIGYARKRKVIHQRVE